MQGILYKTDHRLLMCLHNKVQQTYVTVKKKIADFTGNELRSLDTSSEVYQGPHALKNYVIKSSDSAKFEVLFHQQKVTCSIYLN